MASSTYMYLLFWLFAGLWNVIISTAGWNYLINFDKPISTNSDPRQIRLRLIVFIFGLGYASMMLLDASMFSFWGVLYAGIAGKTMVACQHFYDLYFKYQTRPGQKKSKKGVGKLSLTPLTCVIIGDCFWIVGFCFILLYYTWNLFRTVILLFTLQIILYNIHTYMYAHSNTIHNTHTHTNIM